MKLPSISIIGVLLSGVSSAATVHLGPYQTAPASADGSGAVNSSVSYTIDLSNLTGLTLGAPIQIAFTPEKASIWSYTFMAATGQLAFAWRAEMEISVGGFSTTFADTSSFGPIPFEHDPMVAAYAGYEVGPAPATRSLVVPWGTDLSNLTFALRDLSRIISGVPGFSLTSRVEGTGASFMTTSVAAPEIGIERGEGNFLDTNAATAFGVTVPGNEIPITLKIRNTGASPLILSGASLTGPDKDDFRIAPSLTGTVAAGGSFDFTVTFAPSSAGLRSSTFTLLNNDADESTFTLGFSGNALSATNDTDADGLNDASEFNMATLGFNWEVDQSALVNTYYQSANGAGLFTVSQVQALHTGTPLIARDLATGKFKLTMDWKKSTNLTNFLDFPAPPGSAVSISPGGDVEFEFPSTDDAAFFRIEVE